jgi:hypothetical protein
MQIQEHTTKAIETGTQFEVHTSIEVDLNFPNATTQNDTPRLFESIARTTFAERYPLLTVLAISCGLLTAALFTEIECLKGSGYFWR